MSFISGAWDILYQIVVGGDADMEGNSICLHIPFSRQLPGSPVKESFPKGHTVLFYYSRSCQEWLFHAAADKLTFNGFPCLLRVL